MPDTLMQVTLTYQHPKRGEEKRLVTPSNISLGNPAFHPELKGRTVWYLKAFDHDRKSTRLFPLSYITAWEDGDHRDRETPTEDA